MRKRSILIEEISVTAHLQIYGQLLILNVQILFEKLKILNRLLTYCKNAFYNKDGKKFKKHNKIFLAEFK